MGLARRKTATPEECAEALGHLSDADLRRLNEVACLRAAGLESVDGRDLLHEAIVRMLAGKRRWPCDVPLPAFLLETMRSIASNQRQRQELGVVAAESEILVDAEIGDGVIASAADMTMAPEERTIAADTLRRIDALFEGDADALAVLADKANGFSPGEIQQQRAMDKTRYATTLRRIRRGVATLSEKGGTKE